MFNVWQMQSRRRRIGIYIAVAGCAGLGIVSNLEECRTAIGIDGRIHSIVQPVDQQVIQDSGAGGAEVGIDGRIGLLSRQVDVAFVAESSDCVANEKWRAIGRPGILGGFSGRISLHEGWYRLFIRNHGAGSRTREICFGVGDVYIVAGQSNAHGASSTLFLSRTQLVRKAEFDSGDRLTWKRCDDPQVANVGGSVWPIVGDALVERYGRPVGFINVAVGATSISEWCPGKPHYQRLLKALDATRPHLVKAILWHQGESDRGMSCGDYFHALTQIVSGVRQYAGRDVPWVVATATYNSEDGCITEVRSAQEKSWRAGLALRGPDTDTLGSAYREADGVHFNGSGTRAAGKLWCEALCESDLYKNVPLSERAE